ncbi:rhamnulokinase [Planctomycetes bacterium K23_9]|uniref:Rhamnulokinase n=1 Tax=Stieleria marina TaxID=1930275 RepID=A0A517NSB8_9BACT|nr:Rhamnulokinase [Planctomycetes bacterium K23_9]
MNSSQSVHLAVDLGASSGRVIAAGLDEGRLWLNECHRFENEPVWIQDSLHWNVHGLWRDIVKGLRVAADQYDKIESVGVDTWGVDYVLLDASEQLAGPVRCYRDPRNQGSLESGFAIVPRDEIFAATGLQFMEINSLFQLHTAVKCNDATLGIAESFLMMGDFFHWLLSGKKSIEATMASTSQMLDPRTKQWREDLLTKFAIPTKLFSPVTQPGTNLGNVQPSVVAMTGLDNVPVIVPATHDTASAIVSVPTDDFAPDKPTWCYISSGTWSLMGVEVAQPKINALCAELNFTNEGGVQGSTRLLKNIGGLWVFQQIRKSLQRRGEDVSWDDMVTQAKQAKPFALLLDPDAGEFVAPHDMIDAIVDYAKRTGQAEPEGNGTLFRAALEGLALRYRSCLGMLESLVENRIETIHIVGGGSLNAFLCQMTADACGRTVVAGPVEATAIGNIAVQMIGTGRLQSIAEARKLIRDSFDAVTYQPQNAAGWDEPAVRFDALSSQA